MATLGLGFTISANATRLAEGVNEAVKMFGRLNESAAHTSSVMDAVGEVNLTNLFAGIATGNWAAVGAEVATFVGSLVDLEAIAGEVQRVVYETAESVQQVSEAAERAGVSFSTMQAVHLESIGVAADDMLRLGVALTEIDASRLMDVAKAADKVEQSQTRVGQATDALVVALSVPFAGIFESFDESAAALQNSFANLVGGITQFVDPILSAIAPLIDMLAMCAELCVRFVAAVVDVIAIVLRLGGVLLSIPLAAFAEGFQQIADAMQTVLRTAFGRIEKLVSSVHEKIDSFINYLADLGWIERAIPKVPEIMPVMETEADIEEAKALEEVINRQHEALNKAADEAMKFGNEGFDAAYKYQEQLRELDDMLRRGILNEESYGQAAREAAEGFREQMDAIKDRNKEEEKRKKDLNKKVEKAEAAVEKASEFQKENRIQLGRRATDALKANDVRSSEGMATFIALATGREDPALEENRKQTKKLAEAVAALHALDQQPVEIIGAAA